jgi:hypothetical protein
MNLCGDVRPITWPSGSLKSPITIPTPGTSSGPIILVPLGSNLGSKVRASRPNPAGRKPNTHGPWGSRAPRSLGLGAGRSLGRIQSPRLEEGWANSAVLACSMG